jgi:hypothetical protein
MESSPSNTQYIKEQIQHAFRGIDQPGRKMIPADAPSCEIEIKALMSKKWKTWSDITDKVIEYHYDALSFISPEGYKFILPAFMTYALNNPESDKLVENSTIYSLMAPDRFRNPIQFEWFTLKTSQFNNEQVDAIILFLEYEEHKDWIAPPNNATKALEGYWRHRNVL